MEHLRLKRPRLDRVHPEPLLELHIATLAWVVDTIVQLSSAAPAPPDWARVRAEAGARITDPVHGFGSPGARAARLKESGGDRRISDLLLPLIHALAALDADVYRRTTTTLLETVRAAVGAGWPDDVLADTPLLRPFVVALRKKPLGRAVVRTADGRAALARRVFQRLIAYLEVKPRRGLQTAVWIAGSPIRHISPVVTPPAWDAALARFFVEDLPNLRASYLPALRLERKWAIWHVTNAEHARLRRELHGDTGQRRWRRKRDGEELDLELEPADAAELEARLPGFDPSPADAAVEAEQDARWHEYLERVARSSRCGPQKAEALRWFLGEFKRGRRATWAEAARRAGIARKTLYLFRHEEKATIKRLIRGEPP